MPVGHTSILVGLFFTVMGIGHLDAQHSTDVPGKVHAISLSAQYIQIKDEFNYGLVFRGPSLLAGYTFSRNTIKDRFQYTFEIGFGGVFNKGAGFAWRTKPIDVYYGRNLPGSRFRIGGYFATDYQWQQYSELQGGRLFWFSTIELGPKIEYTLPYSSGIVNVNVSNSLAGFTSRPDPSTEAYYYDFSFSEFISVANQDLTFGSFDLFNRTKFAVSLQPNSWGHLSIGYRFEYFGYYQAPALSFVSHSIHLNWNI